MISIDLFDLEQTFNTTIICPDIRQFAYVLNNLNDLRIYVLDRFEHVPELFFTENETFSSCEEMFKISKVIQLSSKSSTQTFKSMLENQFSNWKEIVEHHILMTFERFS